MVVGFNHNIRYKGEVFHVQTEDSGRANPHIITLLYRGGTILGSIKTSYADILMTEQLELVVESIMKEQHKDMMRRLKNGEYDSRILGTAQAPAAAAHEAQAAPAPVQVSGATPKPAAGAAATEATAGTAGTTANATAGANATAAATGVSQGVSSLSSKSAAPTMHAAPNAVPGAATAPAAPAAPTQAAPIDSSRLPAETAAAVRQASSAALATALHRQQPTPKETPAPASGAAPASISKRSLDEVILDYLITGEE